MRRPLLPFLILAFLAALAWILLQPTPGPEPGPAGPALEEEDGAAGPVALEGAGGRREGKTAAEAGALRQPKTGRGRFGLHGVVVDEAGEPVPGAWVGAYNSPFPVLDFEVEITEILDHPLDFSLEPVAAALADEEGRFELAGLFGRTVFLAARAPMRLTPRRQRVLPEHLDSGEGVVVHTVTGAALTGRVVDAGGRPVAGAEVLVGPGLKYLIAAFRNRTFFVDRVWTDGSGAFELEAVPAGFALSAHAFDGPTHAGLQEFGPLKKGGRGHVEVRMSPMGGLQGEVVDEEGDGIGGAMVVAVPLDLRRVIPFLRDPLGWTAETGSRGAWRLDRLPHGNFLLLAQGPEGRSAPAAATVTSDASVAPALSIDTRVVVHGRVVDLQGRPVAGARIQLQSIPEPKRSGEERRGAWNQPGGLFLEAAQEILPEFLPEATWTLSEGDGSFTLPAWTQARLRVEAPGFPVHDFRLRELEEDQEPLLVLARPGAVEGMVVDGNRGRPLQFYFLRGELRRGWNAEAEGAQEASVVVVPGESGAAGAAPAEQEESPPVEGQPSPLERARRENEQILLSEGSWRAEMEAMTFCEDPDGRFSLQGLPPGEWTLTAQAEGFTNGVARNVRIEEGRTTRGVIIQMDRGATVRGQVLTADDRTPVAGAVVSVGHGRESGFAAMLQGLDKSTAMAETDAEGFFEVTGVPEGADHVNVLASGFANTSEEIPSIKEAELREGVEVLLKRGGTLTGTVFDRHGNPLPGRMVGAFSPQSRDFQQTATNENGVYRMEHLRQGAYFMLTAALDDESLFTGDVMKILQSSRITQAWVPEGGVVEVDIVDEAAGGCRLTGVLLKDGAPVAGANLALVSTEGSSLLDMRFSTSRTDARGEFVFESLAPGEYRLNVDSEEWTGRLPLTVADVPEDRVQLQVPRTEVTGVVVAGDTGEALEGISVLLVSEDRQAAGFEAMLGGGPTRDWEFTDEQGRFRFEGVSPGRYHLEIQGGRGWGWRGPEEGEKERPPLGNLELPPFELHDGQTLDAGRLSLPVAGRILVRVRTASGEPPPGGASARAVPAGETPEESGGLFGGRSWGREEIRMDGLEDGRYDVYVESQGFVRAVKRGVEVRAGDTTEIEVALSRGVPLRVRVLDPEGQPLGGARIAVFDADGVRVNDEDNVAAAFSRFFGGRGDGSYEVGTFAAGLYRVEAEWQGQVRSLSVSLVEGAPEEPVEIRF